MVTMLVEAKKGNLSPQERMKVLECLAEVLQIKLEMTVEKALKELGYSLNDFLECHLILSGLSPFDQEIFSEDLIFITPKAHLGIQKSVIFDALVKGQLVKAINAHLEKEDLLLLSQIKSTDAWGNLALEKRNKK